MGHAASKPKPPTKKSQRMAILQEKPDMWEAFDFCDKDKSGKIDEGELKAAMRLLHYQPDDAEVKKMFMDMDTDGSGQIDFDEFVQMMTERKGAQEISRQIFYRLVHSGSKIKKADLEKAAQEFNINFSPQELEEMISVASKDGISINEDDFYELLMKKIHFFDVHRR